MTARWRLLETGAGFPAWNMALDEALLLRFQEGDLPVLRLYLWKPGALSLGRFQSLSDVASLPAGIPRVRRLTGGGALHHREDELTYSIVAAYSAFPGGKGAGPRAAYHAVHEAIARGLGELGLAIANSSHGPTEDARKPAALCYDRATDYDLTVQRGRKLVGSAQRRAGRTFLQHGAIPVSRDPYSRGAVALEELLGRKPSPAEVARAVTSGIETSLEVSLEPSVPRDDELELARKLAAERYTSATWTGDRP